MCSSNGGLVQAISTSEMLLMIKTRERFIAPGELTIQREIGRINTQKKKKKKRCELERKHRKKNLRKENFSAKKHGMENKSSPPTLPEKEKKDHSAVICFFECQKFWGREGGALFRGALPQKCI